MSDFLFFFFGWIAFLLWIGMGCVWQQLTDLRKRTEALEKSAVVAITVPGNPGQVMVGQPDGTYKWEER